MLGSQLPAELEVPTVFPFGQVGQGVADWMKRFVSRGVLKDVLVLEVRGKATVALCVSDASPWWCTPTLLLF